MISKIDIITMLNEKIEELVTTQHLPPMIARMVAVMAMGVTLKEMGLSDEQTADFVMMMKKYI